MSELPSKHRLSQNNLYSHPLSPAHFEVELRANILPFWINHTVDRENGGFYGAVTNSGLANNQVERSSVLCSRILWTFSTASRIYKDPACLQMAHWAFTELSTRFHDPVHQGVYWSINHLGIPVNDRKHTYAQAFAIYGLSAYYLATADETSLALARNLYQQIETYTADPINGGNIECRARDWSTLPDMRLSTKDLNSSKSMNTLLHLTEAYTSLYSIWKDASLKRRLEDLLQIFLTHIIDSSTAHQRLFFDDRWNSLSDHVSFGHDIESSWLLLETAETIQNSVVLQQVQSISLNMAAAVYNQALGADGSLIYESSPRKQVLSRQWWAHAEAVVGFYNAWQLSGQQHYLQASSLSWQYIQAHFIDRKHGDWYKVLRPDGTPVLSHHKVGPWECPYHHARMCMEMIRRLS